LVHDPVTVIIQTIAVVVARWSARRAVIFDLTCFATCVAGGLTGSDATRRRLRQVVLVEGAIAVVIDSVARGIIRARCVRLAVPQHMTSNASRRCDGYTGSDSTSERLGDEVLVQQTIAVVIDPVAARVVPRRRIRNALIHERPVHTLQRAHSHARADATERRHRYVVFVRDPATVIVDAVARGVVLGRL
jgi:hypothetical protein